MSITSNLSSSLLNLFFRRQSYTPTGLYMGLLDAAGVELSGSGYARVDISSAFGEPSDGMIANSAQITFPAATGIWKSTFVSIFNAPAGGQALATIKWQIMTHTGQQLTFAPTSVKIHLTDVPDTQYYNGFNERHINWRFTGADVWNNYVHLRGKKLPVVNKIQTLSSSHMGGSVLLRDGRVFIVNQSTHPNGVPHTMYNPETGLFESFGGTTSVIGGHYGAILLQDNRVLCIPYAGSRFVNKQPYYPSVGVIFDIESGAIDGNPTLMNTNGLESFIGGTLLSDGRVFLSSFGGSSSLVFDPVTNSSITVSTGGGRAGALLLPDGRVACFSLTGTAGIAIYDPTNNSVTHAIEGIGTGYYGGVLLPDGRIFCVGYNSTCKVCDLSDNTYIDVGITGYIGATLLPDGRILTTGNKVSNLAIYDPITNSTEYISTGTSIFISATLMKDGRVFCLGYQGTPCVVYGTARGYTLPDARVLSAYDNKF